MKQYTILILLFTILNFINLNNSTTTPINNYISIFNGTDSNTCGQTIETPCKTMNASLTNLQSQYPGYNITTQSIIFNFFPGTYSHSQSIDLNGLNVIIQPYYPSGSNQEGLVYFNGLNQATLFTSSGNWLLTNITFIDIHTTDCTINPNNVNNNAVIFTISNWKIEVFFSYRISITFSQCTFECLIYNAPLISITNGTNNNPYVSPTIEATTSDPLLLSNTLISIDQCHFGNLMNLTDITVFKNISDISSAMYFNLPSIPTTLTITNSGFSNLNSEISMIVSENCQLTMSTITMINLNFYNTIMIKSVSSQVNLNNVNLDYVEYYGDNSSMYSFESTQFTITGSSIFVTLNATSDTATLINIVNSFGTISNNYLSSDSNQIECDQTSFASTQNSNVNFRDNTYNQCGYVYSLESYSTIFSSYNKYRGALSIKCSNSSFIGTNDLIGVTCSNVSPSNNNNGTPKNKLLVPLIIVSIIAGLLSIVLLITFIRNRLHHHHNNKYSPIH